MTVDSTAARWQQQTQFIDSDGRNRGNCLAASLASVLNLDLATIPHFVQQDDDGGGSWWTLMQDWLTERGWWMVNVPKSDVMYDAPARVLLLASGPSPRDPTGKTKHMVVWQGGILRHQGGGLVHDPHPDGTGLVGEPESWAFYALVPIDPAAKA